VVHPPKLPGPAHSGLDFIGNQQGTISRAGLSGAGKEIRRRNDASGFALDRFQYDTGDPYAHRIAPPELVL
jgi:hypothetical protein